MHVRTLTIILVLSLVSTAAGQERTEPPYLGAWKLNVAKSNFGGPMLTYELLPDGSMRSTRPGLSPYTFRTDGKEYKAPWGVTTWEPIDPNTWNQRSVTPEKAVYLTKVSLSPDGNTLTMDGTVQVPNGKPTRSVDVYTRLSGGPGLEGQWGVAPSSVPATMDVKPSGANGVTVTIGPTACSAQFDGKDSPMAFGTCAVSKVGTNGLVVVTKAQGQGPGRITLTAAADGKTLTGEFTGQDAKMTLLYERQR